MSENSEFSDAASDRRFALCFERSLQNCTASYKFFWLRALLTLAERGIRDASFLDMGALMTAHAWDPVVYFRLRLGASDCLGQAVDAARSALGLPDDASFDEAASAIRASSDPKLRGRVLSLTRYVPCRFLRPCFPDELVRSVPDTKLEP